ncbi:LysM peptidoglycan-binding domain-containing M23 family metallopeptidase [Cohnella sp. 56]|uniref:LysM peptidoglycan-binding domain-containing M23 family metallopeptidase n=1 Tax=Cohnella sp. 56 TaxID=3113722 RepID=UPI0030E8E9F8
MNIGDRSRQLADKLAGAAVRLKQRAGRKTAIVVCAAAVAAAGGTVLVKQHIEANTLAYTEVWIGGEHVGDVSDRSVIEARIGAKAAELEAESGEVQYRLDEGQVTYRAAEAYGKKLDDAAVAAQIGDRLKTHPTGVQLIIDGQAVAVVRDQETAERVLQQVKAHYAPAEAEAAAKKAPAKEVQTLSFGGNQATVADGQALSSSGPGRSGKASGDEAAGSAARTAAAPPADDSATFEEAVKIAEPAPVSPDKVEDADALVKRLIAGHTVQRIYKVKAGDCIGCIADAQQVSEDIIYQNNPWIEDDKIKIGDELNLTVQEPLLNVRSEETVTQTETIDAPLEIRKTDELKAGKSKIVRPGVEGKRIVTYKLLRRNGLVIEEEQVSSKVVTPALSTVVLKGTKVTPSEGSGNLAWPVSGHRITSYYGKRWGRLHKGLDMVGSSSVKAADNGVVELADDSMSGYGNAIIINHNNGSKTLYGHLSKINVKVGQVVEQGEAIGVMGNTGHSFGTHLHFEVYMNGKLKNPADYL